MSASSVLAYDCSDPYLYQNDPSWGYYCQAEPVDTSTPGTEDKTESNGSWEKAVKECQYGKPKCKK